MKIFKPIVRLAVFLLLAFGLSGGVFAESKITASGQSPYAGARIAISLNENIYYGGKNKIEFKISGLQPKSTYTVWLAKGSLMAGLGDFPYLFAANSAGRATYSAKLEAHKLGNWQTIKVVLHKDGNAQNTAETNLIEIFLVDIKEFLSGKKSSSEDKSSIKPRISIYKGLLKP